MYAWKKYVCNLFVVLLGFWLQGCAGAAVPLPVDEIESIMHNGTLNGIERALAGSVGTFILRRLDMPEQFIVAWRNNGGYSFVLLDASARTAKTWREVTGQITTPQKFSDFVRDAIALKFKWVKCEDAAFALYQGFELAKSWIGHVATTELMPVFNLTGFEDLPYQFLPPAGEDS